MKTFIEMTLCVAALLCAAGCAPSECKQALPLILEVESALASGNLSTAQTPAEKLTGILPQRGDNGLLHGYSKDLAERIEKSRQPVLTDEDRDRRDYHLERLPFEIKYWQESAKKWRHLCN